MAGRQLGVIAAGHPSSARAGAAALREGGNAVDAALGAMLASFAAEPVLTGLGAGGYMLVTRPGEEPVLLDFFVESPGRGGGGGTAAAGVPRAELIPINVSFGDAEQVFHVGSASVGSYGVPAGICEASRRFGRMSLAELVAPAAALARDGVVLNAEQAYVIEILSGIVTSTPEARALFAPRGELVRLGDRLRQPELAGSLERLAAEGADPFYTGDVARAISEWVQERGGLLGPEDLAAYRVLDREPLRTAYRGRTVLTNPPPSAGGILIVHTLDALEARERAPRPEDLVVAMEHTQAQRTPAFLEGLDDPAFVAAFLGRGGAGRGGGRLGSTTHIAVLDAEGGACSVTCSNGSCSGVIVPGTGIHLNNMLGEQDLNPLGFHRLAPGRRLPSMMAPTVVMHDGRPQLVLGSAGSNRIRSAIVQTISRVLDEGLLAPAAVRAPRLHPEDGVIYSEPGIDLTPLRRPGRVVAPFRGRNLFFGGVQAVQRDASGHFWGAGDPRRGGGAVVVKAGPRRAVSR